MNITLKILRIKNVLGNVVLRLFNDRHCTFALRCTGNVKLPSLFSPMRHNLRMQEYEPCEDSIRKAKRIVSHHIAIRNQIIAFVTFMLTSSSVINGKIFPF